MVMDYIIDDSEIRNRPIVTEWTREIASLRFDNKSGISGSLYYICIPHCMEEFVQHDGNIIAMSCFPPFPRTSDSLDFILQYINKNVKDENTKVFFDNLHEGHVLGCIKGIHAIVKQANLNPKNIYFFSGGMEAQKLYDQYCIKHGIISKINIRVLLVWERHISHNSPNTANEIKYEIKIKDKLFLCFNRMARKQRIALLGLLYSKKIVDRAFYSFFPSYYGSTSCLNILHDLKNCVSESLFNTISQEINLNYSKFPLLLNTTTVDDNANYVKTDDAAYYSNSYFSLVTETFFFNTPRFGPLDYEEQSVFFSEKIFKPIIGKHPFIQLNRPHALGYLRKIGYKTFHPYINESYDTIENDEERLVAIVAEVERLSKQTPEQWIEWQRNVAPVVEHNYKTITSKSIKDHVFVDTDYTVINEKQDWRKRLAQFSGNKRPVSE